MIARTCSESPPVTLREWAGAVSFFEALPRIARESLPFVYGVATTMLPDRPGAPERIAKAVMQTLAIRGPRLPKRTILATWLYRTTQFAVARESRSQPASTPPSDSESGRSRAFLERLHRLPPKFIDAILLRRLLPAPAAVGRAVTRRERRWEKRAVSGLRRIEKHLRKEKFLGDAPFDPPSVHRAPPDEEVEEILSVLGAPSGRSNRSPLVVAALRSWRWVAVRNWARRAATGFAVLIVALLATGLVVSWLVRNGHLTAWFIQNASRIAARETPELLQPARVWPSLPGEEERVSKRLPENPAELYALTNIWLAELRFTADQWKAIEPSRVPPVRDFFGSDGRLNLRNPKAQRSGLAGALGFDFNWVQAELIFAGVEFPRVGARYRGNGTYINSLFGPKQSFKVDLNRNVKGQKLGGVKTLNFLNLIVDYSYLRDALGQRFFRDLGVPGPRTSYAYLTLRVEGKPAVQPLGLYLLVENIDADFAEDRFGSKGTPVFKPVTYELFEDLGDRWEAYAPIYDLKTKATPEQLQRVMDFARLVTHADDGEFSRRLAEFLDLEEFAAFLAGHVLLSSYDGFLTNGQNYYLYLDPRSNRFGFISWDQDHGWGEFGYIGTPEQREQASLWHPSTYQHRFLDRVLSVEAFRSIYRQKIEDAMSRLFTEERIHAQIDAMAALLRPAVAAESDFRLARFDLSTQSEWIPGPRVGAPEGPKAPVHQLKRFVTTRIASVRDQLSGRSEGARLKFP